MLKYCQNSLNSCCYSSLAPAFDSIKQPKAANAISMRIEESLKRKVGNCMDLANFILKNENKLKANKDLLQPDNI